MRSMLIASGAALIVAALACTKQDAGTSTTQTTGATVPAAEGSSNMGTSSVSETPSTGTSTTSTSGDQSGGDRDIDRSGAPLPSEPQTQSVEGANPSPTGGVTDQKNDALDLGITKDLRVSLMQERTLSFWGKNVKITTVNGVVTLRGPVKTDAEKTLIESRAKAIHGVTSVNDELTVQKGARLAPAPMMQP